MNILQMEQGKSFTIEISRHPIKSREIEMVWIPAGKFNMVVTRDESLETSTKHQETVEISDGYWLSRYPITIIQWMAILEEIPSGNDNTKLDKPVHGINWYNAMMFCWEMNRLFSGRHIPKGYKFSLPVEAQWEYACRATTETRFYNGNDESKLAEIAWFQSNSNGEVQPVGKKAPNKWGLYDMLGNVYEWCLDTFSEQPNLSMEDRWDNPSYTYRVIRGGSCREEAKYVQCSSRGYQYPIDAVDIFGFRLCLSNIDYKLVL